MPPRKLKMSPQGKGGMLDYVKQEKPPMTTKDVIEHVVQPVIETIKKARKPKLTMRIPPEPTPTPPKVITLSDTPPKPTTVQTTSTPLSMNDQVKLFVKAMKEAQSPTIQARERLTSILSGTGAGKLSEQERKQLKLELAQKESNEALEEYSNRYKIVGEDRVYKDPRYWRYLTQMSPMPPDPTTAGNTKEMYQKIKMLSLFPNLFNDC
jgi:hypothetical protein